MINQRHWKPLFVFFSLMMFFVAASSVLAEGGQGDPGRGGTGDPPPSVVPITVKIDNPFKFGGDLFSFVEALVGEVILPIGGVLCVLAFIYSGFMYVWARGNPSEIDNAHRALLYSSIGTAILLGAWVIAEALRNTLNQLVR